MKYVLITGAANGVGKSITEALANNGWMVFATDKDKKTLEGMHGRNIIPIYMDVTKEETIIDAYMKVGKETIYLDAIINNAGTISMGSLIEDDIDKVEKVLNVNLYGMMRVNKAFYPLLNKETGRIININSESGWMSPVPFKGAYTISKYAIEAYNDTLRRELNFLGIKVIKVQCGLFRSSVHKNILSSFRTLINKTKYYKNELKSMSEILKEEFDNPNDVKYIKEVIIEACNSEKPKLCYRVKNNKKLSWMNILPESTIDKIYKNKLSK